jgi:hypothetical protein
LSNTSTPFKNGLIVSDNTDGGGITDILSHTIIYAQVKDMADRAKFILFTMGLAVAVASSFVSFYLLYSSLLGNQNIVYEPNSTLALIEMAFLVLAIGTCIVASEVYYRYLEIKRSIYIDRVEQQNTK